MIDSRLIGTWRSDAGKTALEIAARRDIPSASKMKLRRFFGKLELHYTRTHCHARMGDFYSVSRYIVVAKDASSVAIVVSDSIAGEQIVHIHFEGKRHWVSIGSGLIREFFKRVNPKRKDRSKRKR